MQKYFPNDFKACEPGAEFSRFLWEVMLMEEEVRTRISKGIRSAENMDHDDAHLYIPPTTPGEIDGILTSSSGQKKYFTNAGYANGYAGFNQYIVSLSHSYEEEEDGGKRDTKLIGLRDTISAFIRYDAILDDRLYKDKHEHYARLDDRHFQRSTVVDEGVVSFRYTEISCEIWFLKSGVRTGKIGIHGFIKIKPVQFLIKRG